MIVVDPKNKPVPFLTEGSHAALRHDHATWHPDHLDQALAATRPVAKGEPLPFAGRSKFDSRAILNEVVTRSQAQPGVRALNGYIVTTFDLGYVTGWDARAGRKTTSATVVTKVSGEVITAHPGTPWSS